MKTMNLSIFVGEAADFLLAAALVWAARLHGRLHRLVARHRESWTDAIELPKGRATRPLARPQIWRVHLLATLTIGWA